MLTDGWAEGCGFGRRIGVLMVALLVVAINKVSTK
jgi:hypothetical protein